MARKHPRIYIPLPEETLKRVEELALFETRPVANMASVLIQAAVELIDEQDFKLVGSKLRRITFDPLEAEDQD